MTRRQAAIMRTMYRTKPELAEAFLRIVDETDTCGKLRPEHFIEDA